MKGTAIKLINDYIARKARGNKVLENSIRTKFILGGVNVVNLNDKTPDDLNVINKIKMIINANP